MFQISEMLLCFETRMTETQPASKIKANFRTFFVPYLGAKLRYTSDGIFAVWESRFSVVIKDNSRTFLFLVIAFLLRVRRPKRSLSVNTCVVTPWAPAGMGNRVALSYQEEGHFPLEMSLSVLCISSYSKTLSRPTIDA